MRRISMLVAMLAMGCASGGGGPTTTGGGTNGGTTGGILPSDHTLTSDRYEEFPGYLGIQFSIPSDATVSYSIQCRSTSPPDTWDVGIFTPAEYAYFSNGQSSNAYAPHQNVSDISDSADISAGDYVLGFKCDNVIENCQLSVTLSAYY